MRLLKTVFREKSRFFYDVEIYNGPFRFPAKPRFSFLKSPVPRHFCEWRVTGIFKIGEVAEKSTNFIPDPRHSREWQVCEMKYLLFPATFPIVKSPVPDTLLDNKNDKFFKNII